MPSALETARRKFKAEVSALDEQAMRQLTEAYWHIWQQTKVDLNTISTEIIEGLRDRKWPTREMRMKQRRLDAILADGSERLARFAQYADGKIQAAELAAIELARQHAQLSIELASNEAGVAISWHRIHEGAVEKMIGYMQDGSPVRAALDKLGPEVSSGMKKALSVGIGTGQNPRVIAKIARQQYGVGLQKALTISRTEILRSYRDAALENYRANEDVVNAWEWIASLSRRTCAMCLAMNGTIHPLDEDFGSHPNCRCTPAPIVSERYATKQTENAPGEAWLKEQSEEVQEKVLGVRGAAAWRDGRVDLRDFVGVHESPSWGRQYVRRSLTDALAAHKPDTPE